MRDLEQDVITWAAERGILEHPNTKTQMLKTVSEVGELLGHIEDNEPFDDDIGDTIVTLIVLCRLCGTNFAECEVDDFCFEETDSPCLTLPRYIGHLADTVAKGRDIKKDVLGVMGVLGDLAQGIDETLRGCLFLAYTEIKDRKGQMVNGTFVKQGDTG